MQYLGDVRKRSALDRHNFLLETLSDFLALEAKKLDGDDDQDDDEHDTHE